MAPSKSFEVGSGRYRGKTIRFRKNHFIVKFKQYDGNSDDARQILKSVIGHSNFEIIGDPIGNWNYFWVDLDDSQLLGMVEKLKPQFRNEVEYAEPALIMVPTIQPNDDIFEPGPPFPDPEWELIDSPPWAFKIINMFKAWDIQTGTHDVILGLLDSGLPLSSGSNPMPNLHDSLGPYLNHDDLDGNRFIAGMDYVKNQPWPHDDYFYHGINLAGIMAAKEDNGKGLAGLNWVSQVYVYKSLVKSSDQENLPQNAYALKSDVALVHMGIRDVLNYADEPLSFSPRWDTEKGCFQSVSAGRK